MKWRPPPTQEGDERLHSQLIAINQRLSGLKDDIELMLKAELMGSLANFETRIEHLIAGSIGSRPRVPTGGSLGEFGKDVDAPQRQAKSPAMRT